MSEIAPALRSYMKNTCTTQEVVSQKLGIHQSQISRLLNGEYQRLSPNLKKFCDYAKIEVGIRVRGKSKKQLSRKLSRVVAEVWDGSKQHEYALIRIIRSLKALP